MYRTRRYYVYSASEAQPVFPSQEQPPAQQTEDFWDALNDVEACEWFFDLNATTCTTVRQDGPPCFLFQAESGFRTVWLCASSRPVPLLEEYQEGAPQ